MIQRCVNEKSGPFRDYGGRGIKVCAAWQGRGGFAQFIADVGYPPTERHMIDRIDVNGNYEVDNVRWVTPRESALNRRPPPREHLDIGAQFNSWTVLADSVRVNAGRYHYRCKCRCGTERDVAMSALKSGSSKSCGCRRRKTT